ncbi:hypothetical protein D3C71_1933100 [compost metagenome]
MQVQVFAGLVAQHGVVQPVGIQLDPVVGRGEVALADIARAVADADVAWQIVGGP